MPTESPPLPPPPPPGGNQEIDDVEPEPVGEEEADEEDEEKESLQNRARVTAESPDARHEHNWGASMRAGERVGYDVLYLTADLGPTDVRVGRESQIRGIRAHRAYSSNTRNVLIGGY